MIEKEIKDLESILGELFDAYNEYDRDTIGLTLEGFGHYIEHKKQANETSPSQKKATVTETTTAKELLSDENIKKMASEYTGGQEDYQAFILACNVISEKMKSLKLYYWQKRDYHEGASFALAESVEEAKSLIIEKFKTNYLEDYKGYYFVKNFISNGRANEEEFFTEETSGAYTILKEELEKEPQIFDISSKQGFYIWASL